jgi:hypothetical protein
MDDSEYWISSGKEKEPLGPWQEKHFALFCLKAPEKFVTMVIEQNVQVGRSIVCVVLALLYCVIYPAQRQ